MEAKTVKLLSVAEIQKTAYDNGYAGVSQIHLEKTGYNISKAYFLSLLMNSWVFYTDNDKAENKTFYACEKYINAKTGISEKSQSNYLNEFKKKGWIVLSIIKNRRNICFTQEFMAEFSLFLRSKSEKFTDADPQNLPTEPAKFADADPQNLRANKKDGNKTKKNKNANAQKSARAGEDFFNQKNNPVSTSENPSKKVPLKKVSPAVEAALPLAFDFFKGWLEKMDKSAPAQTNDEVSAMITVLEFFEKRQEAYHAAKGTVPTAQGLVSALATCFDALMLARVESVENNVKQRQISLGEEKNANIDYFLGRNLVRGIANQISSFCALAYQVYEKATSKAQKQQQTANTQTAPKAAQTANVVLPPARPVQIVVEDEALPNPPKDVKEWLDNLQADEEQQRAQIAEQISALDINYSKKCDINFLEYANRLAKICTVGEFLAYATNQNLLRSIPNGLIKHSGSRSHNPLDYYKILIAIYNDNR